MKAEDLNFKPGTLIVVLWLDACESRSVNVNNIPNKAFATYKKSVGYFVGLKQDHRYREWHLLFTHEYTDDERMDITSIPLAVVKKVEVVNAKTGLITVKDKPFWLVTVPVLKLKRAEKVEQVDGCFKIILRKEMKKFR